MIELAFELPQMNREIRAEIVRAIPPEQICLNGVLNAPRELIEAGQVAINTGHIFGRGHTIAARAPIGKADRSYDAYGLIFERKLPDFLAFRDVGLIAGNMIGDEGFLRAIAEHLMRGYTGALHLQFGTFPRLERCNMFFEVTEGRRLGQKLTNPPHIIFSGDDRHADNPWGRQQPIIDACRKMKLVVIDHDLLVRPEIVPPAFIS